MPLRGQISKRRGVTLTEVMIGVVIMVIIIFPILQVILSESVVVTGTKEHSQAAYIGQRLLETARTYNFQKLQELVDFYADAANQKITVDGTDFFIKDMDLINIQTTDPAPVDDTDKIAAKRLKFSVTYKARDKLDMSLDLATIIARHE